MTGGTRIIGDETGAQPQRPGWLRRTAPALLSVLVLPGLFWPYYEFVERNDNGFHYRDWKGSPYDQMRTGDPRLDQIQCPPPQRPRCGD